MNVLSVEQFDRDSLAALFNRADQFRDHAFDNDMRRHAVSHLAGKQLCNLLYESSEQTEPNHTRISFETSAVKLGMGVITIKNSYDPSVATGERLEDTVQLLNANCHDVIVLQHPSPVAAARAVAVSDAPIISAGNGQNGHVTQTLLDAYTIHNQFKTLGNLNIVMGGNVAHDGAVQSLARLLSTHQKNHISFVSTPDYPVDQVTRQTLVINGRQNGTTFDETMDMYGALENADVVYWSHIPEEQAESPLLRQYGAFYLGSQALAMIQRRDAIIMHAMPRGQELSPVVDSSPKAKYFEQTRNGLFIRMALIDQVVSEYSRSFNPHPPEVQSSWPI